MALVLHGNILADVMLSDRYQLNHTVFGKTVYAHEMFGQSELGQIAHNYWQWRLKESH